MWLCGYLGRCRWSAVWCQRCYCCGAEDCLHPPSHIQTADTPPRLVDKHTHRHQCFTWHNHHANQNSREKLSIHGPSTQHFHTNRANMHAEKLIINCASIIKWKFATSSSEGTNGKHLFYLHDDRESSKRGYIVRLNRFCGFPSGLWGIQSHWLSTKFACSCKHTKVTTRCSTCV